MKMQLRALCATVLLLSLSACDTTSTSGAAPTPIPSAAFKFESLQGASLAPNAPEASSKSAGLNYINAVLRVAILNTAVGTHLIIPAGLTDAVTRNQPSVVDGTYIWNGSGRIGDWNVNARLEGAPDGDQVNWELFWSGANVVTQENVSDFRIYTATSNLEGTEGTWDLYYQINGAPTMVASAAFDITSATEREITFTIPQTNPDAEARGASVRYAVDGTDRTVDYRERIATQRHLIFWKEGPGTGFLEAWNWNNGQRACWDFQQNDTACAAS